LGHLPDEEKSMDSPDAFRLRSYHFYYAGFTLVVRLVYFLQAFGFLYIRDDWTTGYLCDCNVTNALNMVRLNIDLALSTLFQKWKFPDAFNCGYSDHNYLNAYDVLATILAQSNLDIEELVIKAEGTETKNHISDIYPKSLIGL
jgi:hypothetical protein